MSEKIINLRYKGSPIEIKTEATIKPEDLYGKQKKSVELDGTPLKKVVITPWGDIFDPQSLTIERTDAQGSLDSPPIPCSPEDQSELPILPSSYKTTRLLQDATTEDLANFKTRSTIPIQTTLPQGIYKTKYNYRDSATLEPALLNVTETHAFLLVGEETNPPYLKKEESYSLFEEEENENPDEEMTFSIF